MFLEWGLAMKLASPEWQDAEGNEVPKENVMGHPVQFTLLYPDLILVMDETGNSGNHSDDKATRAYMVMCKTGGPPPTPSCATDDITWTSQGFTSLFGKAVLYVVIIRKARNWNSSSNTGLISKRIG